MVPLVPICAVPGPEAVQAMDFMPEVASVRVRVTVVLVVRQPAAFAVLLKLALEVGLVLSSLATWVLFDSTFPAWSVAWKVTVVVPSVLIAGETAAGFAVVVV